MSNKVYGIDLGTTYSVIATIDDSGMPRVIQNVYDGKDTLASAVYFPEGGDPVIGEVAKNQAEIEPERVVQFVKREIGRETIEREFNGQTFDAINISALILKRLKAYADEQGENVEDVIITCPAYFGIEERTATKQAGEIAGLNVLDIINEPTAAALNYCYKEFQENKKILIYDLGGGTFDVTLINLTVNEDGESKMRVLGTGGDARLGGKDWDDRLSDFMLQQYIDETGKDEADISLDERISIRTKAEETKIKLTNLISVSLTIKDGEGEATRLEVTKEQFEEQTADLVESTLGYIRALLEKKDLSYDDIDKVLLVGGSTKMPMIKDAVENIFPGKWQSEDPDLAVAKGAALAAAIKHNEEIENDFNGNENGDNQINPGDQEETNENVGDKQTINLIGSFSGESNPFSDGVDIIPRSFGPGIMRNDEYVIDNLLFIGDSAPATTKAIYYTMVDNQSKVKVAVFENISDDHDNKYITPCINSKGEEQDSDPLLEVKHIGDVNIDLPPGMPQGSEIEVQFKLDVSGLEVTVTDVANGNTVSSEIISPNLKTKEQLQQDMDMVATIKTEGQL